MNKQEADKIIKSRYADYCVKYPKLLPRFNGFISSHPYPEQAIALLVVKLESLDQLIEGEFIGELDISLNG